ncbi:MAG: copper resistance CopC family protein [Cellulomonas sp.]
MSPRSARPSVRPREVVARLTAVIFAALVVVSGLAAPASAHDALVSTDPEGGSTVETAPAAVTLTFTQEVVGLGTDVQVVGPTGAPMNDGPVAVLGTVVTQNLLADRPAGAYTVQWRATSADGHPVTGGFTFTATAAVVPVISPPLVAETPPSTPPATPSATSSATASASPSASESAAAVGPADEATDSSARLSVWAIVAAAGAFVLALASANWWRGRRAHAQRSGTGPSSTPGPSSTQR